MRRSPDYLGTIWGINISRRRLLTSVTAALAMVVCAIPFLWPGALATLLSPTAMILSPVVQIILVAPHHFLGGQTKSLTHVITASLIACCLGYISTLINPYQNIWVGLGILIFWSVVIPVVNSISDPFYARINFVRMAILNILFVCTFNQFGPEHGYMLDPALQILIISVFTIIVSVIANIWRYTTPVLIIPEQTAVIANCAASFERLVATLRLPKKKPPPSRSSFELYDLHDSDYVVAPIPNASPETRRLLTPESAEDADKLDEQRSAEEQELRDIEKTLLRQLDGIRAMTVEMAEETWVSQAIRDQYKAVNQAIDAMTQHLVALRLAAETGYINRINLRMIKPIKKDLAIVARESQVWIKSVDIALSEVPWLKPVSKIPATPVPPSQSILIDEENEEDQDKSAEQLPPYAQKMKRHSRAIWRKYASAMKDLELKGHLQVSPTSEIVRFHFFLWKLSQFWKTIYVLDTEVQNLVQLASTDNSWRFWPSRLGYIAKPYLNILESGKDFIYGVKEFCTKPSARPPVKTSVANWLKEGHWRFILRFVLGIAILSACAIVAQQHLPIDPRGVWAAVTFALVVVPTLGGTVKRGWHRFVGTLGGAIVGFVARVVVGVVNEATAMAGGAYVLLLFTLLTSFIATYWLHTKRKPRPYASLVTIFTFAIIAFPSFPYSGPLAAGWYIAPLRTLQVIIGEIAALLICLVFWNRATDKLAASFLSALNCVAIALSGLTIKSVDASFLQADQVRDALQIIHTSIPKQTALLKETKSELYPFRMEQRQMWMDLVGLMKPIASSLQSMQLALRDGFPPNLMELGGYVLPIVSSIEQLIQQDINDAIVYFRERKGKLQSSNAHQIKELLRQLDQIHLQTRETLVKEKLLQFYHNQLVLFNAYLYLFRELAFYWTRFMKKISAVPTV